MSKKKKERFSIALSELANDPEEMEARKFAEDAIKEAQRQEAISMEYFRTGKLPPKPEKSLSERDSKEIEARCFIEGIVRKITERPAFKELQFILGEESYPERVERVSKEFLERFTALRDKRNKETKGDIPPYLSVKCSCKFLKWRDVEADPSMNEIWRNVHGEEVDYKFCPYCGDKLLINGIKLQVDTEKYAGWFLEGKQKNCETCAYRPTNYGDSEICVTRCEKYSEWSSE